MLILYIVILSLVIIVGLLAVALYLFAKKSTYITDKEKEFMVFVIDIFKDYGDDLGIQTKDQHEQLVEELDKIKKKHLETKD
jgi:hypothetical protein